MNVFSYRRNMANSKIQISQAFKQINDKGNRDVESWWCSSVVEHFLRMREPWVPSPVPSKNIQTEIDK